MRAEKNTPFRTPDCTCLHLYRLSWRVAQHYDRYLMDDGINILQYMLLAAAARTEGATVAVLARHVNLSRSALERKLQRLVKMSYVQLKRGSESRARVVQVTPSGRAALENGRCELEAAQESVNAVLGETAVRSLHQLFSQLASSFDEIPFRGERL